MAKYSSTSPYYRTPKGAGFLGIYEPREFNFNLKRVHKDFNGHSRVIEIN